MMIRKILTIIACFLLSAFSMQAAFEPILMAEYSKKENTGLFKVGTRFLPYPDYSDRAAWARFVGDNTAREIIAAGEKYLGWKWRHVEAQAFITTKTGGDHTLKSIETNNRTALVRLAVAEAIEGKGRFMKDLADGFWFYSTSYHWTLVSNTGSSVLPTYDNESVGLGSGRTGQTLSVIWYIFGNEFDKIDKMIGVTFKETLKRLIMDPYLNPAKDADHWWLGKPKKRRLNNHTPWNTCSVLTCFFVMEEEQERLDMAIRKSLEAVDIYINDFPEDGLCDEGPTYWFNSVGRLCALLQLLRDASGGKFDVMPNKRISDLGSYISRCCAGQTSRGKEIVANYGDAEPFTNFDASTLWATARMLGSKELEDLAVFSLWDGKKFKNPKLEKSEGYRAFENLRYSKKIELVLKDISARIADGERPEYILAGLRLRVPSCSYYPYGGQVFIQTADGWFFSGKAAWNNEAHNHNDAGSCILYSNGVPVLVDPGVGTYTNKTFGPLRYTLWTMNSDWHNLPVINGALEDHGGKFKTENPEFSKKKGVYEFKMDIQKAYEEGVDCKLWTRLYRISEKGETSLEIIDRFSLLSRKSPDIERFIVQGNVELLSPGKIRITNKGKEFELSYPSDLLQFSMDVQTDMDKTLRNIWGKTLTRINLTSSENAPLDGEYRIKIRQTIK